MDEQQEKHEKSISDDLAEAMACLSPNQLRYAVARLDYKTKGEAAEAIGLKPDTVYRWNGDVERAVMLMERDRREAALQIAKKNLVKAVMVKVHGLDSDDEDVRQKVATELIEMEFGKPKQRSEVTGDSGGPVLIRVIYDAKDA